MRLIRLDRSIWGEESSCLVIPSRLDIYMPARDAAISAARSRLLLMLLSAVLRGSLGRLCRRRVVRRWTICIWLSCAVSLVECIWNRLLMSCSTMTLLVNWSKTKKNTFYPVFLFLFNRSCFKSLGFVNIQQKRTNSRIQRPNNFKLPRRFTIMIQGHFHL